MFLVRARVGLMYVPRDFYEFGYTAARLRRPSTEATLLSAEAKTFYRRGYTAGLATRAS